MWVQEKMKGYEGFEGERLNKFYKMDSGMVEVKKKSVGKSKKQGR